MCCDLDARYYLFGKYHKENGQDVFDSNGGVAYGIVHHGSIYENSHNEVKELGKGSSIEYGSHRIGILLDLNKNQLYIAVDGKWQLKDPRNGDGFSIIHKKY
jgi:hypothetical protein